MQVKVSDRIIKLYESGHFYAGRARGHTVITRYIVLLCFPTLVFLMRLSFKGDSFFINKFFKVKIYFEAPILEALMSLTVVKMPI